MRIKNYVITILILSMAGYTSYKMINKKPETVKVFVATENLEAGAIISRNNIGAIEISPQCKLTNYTSSLSEVEGKKIKFPIMKDQLILNENLNNKNNIDDKDNLLTITANNNITAIKQGDMVTVYGVKKEKNSTNAKNDDKPRELKELFKDKFVVSVLNKDNSSKKEIVIKTSKKETTDYLKIQNDYEMFVVKIEK